MLVSKVLKILGLSGKCFSNTVNITVFKKSSCNFKFITHGLSSDLKVLCQSNKILLKDSSLFKHQSQKFYKNLLQSYSARCFYTSSILNNSKENDKGKRKNSTNHLIFSTVVGLTMLGFMSAVIIQTNNRADKYKVSMSWEQIVKEILPSGEIDHVYIPADEEHKALIVLNSGATFNNRKINSIETAIQSGESIELFLRREEDKLGISGSKNRIPIVRENYNNLHLIFLVAYLFFIIFVSAAIMKRLPKPGTPPTSKQPDAKRPEDSFPSFNIFKMFDTDVGYAKTTNIKFEDVAGMQEAKQEVVEFVQFLKNPEHYQRLGAKMPRGCLLTGPPGVGKTLLAKAVASEAGVPFIAKAGSDFVEMIGGLGARRIRQLFEKARESAPCIIYIDELDALGAARSSSEKSLPSASEKDQTLNQILVEMDGMLSKQHQVIVLASTNRPDILDKALLRPGRFDRVVHIDLPTRLERKDILNRHLKDIKLQDKPQVYSAQLANETPGMSGADLANICNEAAIYAAREGDDIVEWKHLHYALERVTSGAPKSTTSLTPEERRKVAVHESGHALIGWLLEHTSALAKITIIPRSKGVLGVTRVVPSEKFLHSQEEMLDNMCMALGGRAAEDLIFGHVTQGAQDDLQRVTKMAYAQVKQFGFNDAVGPVSFQEEGNLQVRPYSEALATVIDTEAKKLVFEAYERAKKILKENKHKLENLFNELLNQETLTYDEVVNIIGPPPYQNKTKIRDIPFQDVDINGTDTNNSKRNNVDT